jgi:dipeptidyl aminopeptidase/acylaminoacyl peptidase
MAARSLADQRHVRSLGLRLFLLGIAVAVVIITLDAEAALATFPGTDGRIAFDGVVPGTCCSEIFTAKPDGSDARRLTSTPDPSDSELPDWSPDGQRIAFDSDRTDIDGRKDVAQIYVMNADGSGLTQLTRGPGEQGTASWSPNATSLAISADWGDPALQGIWLIPASDPDGVTQREVRRVTTLPAGVDSDTEPQFSPDGNSIVFTRFKGPGASAIHRVGIDGSGLERISPWRLNASDPDWSPDGQRIAFDSGDSGVAGSKMNIYVVGADGNGLTRLTDRKPLKKIPGGANIRGANNPVWSPSGTQITYTRNLRHWAGSCDCKASRGNVLVAMNPDGSGKHVVVGGRFGKRRYPEKVDWGTHP